MSRICQITKRRPLRGQRVSHSNIKTKREFRPNLHKKRFWLESEKRFVTLRVSARGLRTIDKNGFEAAARKAGLLRPAKKEAA